jgi:HEAT repeat protein
MDPFISFVRNPPSWFLIGAAAAVALVVILVIAGLLRRRALRLRLGELLRHPERAGEFRRRCSPRCLLRHSRLIEKIARLRAPAVIELTGIEELWIAGLKRNRSRRDFRRVLELTSDRGLFQCFLAAMEKPAFTSELLYKLKGDYLRMRDMARAGIGEQFDGRRALDTFREMLPQIREMTGDPEWPSRYFAVKLLVHDGEERSRRALWDAFRDSHPLVRRVAASEFSPAEPDRLEKELIRLILEDPSYEVRSSARQRLHNQFSDSPPIDPSKLENYQVIHLLELLHVSRKQDQDFALRFLTSEDLEQRRAAAEYLGRCGRLRELCLESDFKDLRRFEEIRTLLMNAAAVNVTTFLACMRETSNPAPLQICAEVLEANPDGPLAGQLARRVFPMYSGQKDLGGLYGIAASCLAREAGEEAQQLFLRELKRRSADPHTLGMLLQQVPELCGAMIREALLGFLEDPDFRAKDELRAALKRNMAPVVLERALQILRSDRNRYPHPVRVQALKLLGELQLPYCLQTLLENLYVLPAEQAKEFAVVLDRYAGEAFRAAVSRLLEDHDARVRAALLASLPATHKKEFLPNLRNGLLDADPEVRIASVWALAEYGDFRHLNQAADLVRDPVQRVRVSAARVFGRFGTRQTLDRLRELIFDENEVEEVKRAAVEGLGSTEAETAVDILVEKLDEPEQLEEAIVGALSCGTTPKKLQRLVENFKDASPSRRQNIVQVFLRMRERGEPAIEALLREDIPSLRSHLAEILEKTGYVEQCIRLLTHRRPAARRDTAELLSLIGTASAFRGIVLAARDPDEEVRVRVIKALEKLETKEGREILKELEEDPDERVRKYTAWALERLKAKEL